MSVAPRGTSAPMRPAETIKADNTAPAPALTTRQAIFSDNDAAAFVRLARLCAEERGGTFDEAVARFTFAGTPRSDPAVILLVSGDEAIGFSILRLLRQPFTTERLAREEVLYVLPEHRSLEAELCLHAAALAVFDMWAAVDRELLIPASPHSAGVSRHLAGAGHLPAAVTTRVCFDFIERPTDQPLN